MAIPLNVMDVHVKNEQSERRIEEARRADQQEVHIEILLIPTFELGFHPLSAF